MIRSVGQSSLGYSSTNITDGRRVRTERATPWMHISRIPNTASSLLSGGRRREYIFDVDLFRSASDIQEEDTLDKALQEDVESLLDALDGKTAADFSTLTGVEVIRAELVSRDGNPETRQEQTARIRVTAPFYETR